MGTAVFLAASVMAFGAGCLARSRYERDCLVTEKYRIASEKIHGQGKTIVFLTDLHNKEFGEENSRLLETVRKVKPDAVLFGGDGMVAKRGNSDVRIPLALLTELAKEFPVYCGNGNHESRMLWKSEIYGEAYENYRTALENAGIRYLSNEAADLDSDIRIYGLDLPKSAYLPRSGEIPEGLLKETLGEPDPEKFCLLLAHSPLFFEEYAAWGADLTLSGHFHGGTIRLPLVGGVMTPQYQFFYPRCAGYFELPGRGREKSRMIVGRGLGTHSINIRLNDKPQVVVVRLCGADTQQ
ncbi:MAG: metallophosphoesterase [Clostridiaceae bacterium]